MATEMKAEMKAEMRAEMRAYPIPAVSWKTERNGNTEIWFDADGVGWDFEYVNKFEVMRSALRGRLICAWDADYEQVRSLWTGASERWPAAMVECIEPNDVQVCMAFAQQHGLPVTLREDGHPVAEQAITNGVFLIDMSLV